MDVQNIPEFLFPNEAFEKTHELILKAVVEDLGAAVKDNSTRLIYIALKQPDLSLEPSELAFTEKGDSELPATLTRIGHKLGKKGEMLVACFLIMHTKKSSHLKWMLSPKYADDDGVAIVGATVDYRVRTLIVNSQLNIMDPGKNSMLHTLLSYLWTPYLESIRAGLTEKSTSFNPTLH